jgi:hypothetical protein
MDRAAPHAAKRTVECRFKLLWWRLWILCFLVSAGVNPVYLASNASAAPPRLGRCWISRNRTEGWSLRATGEFREYQRQSISTCIYFNQQHFERITTALPVTPHQFYLFSDPSLRSKRRLRRLPTGALPELAPRSPAPQYPSTGAWPPTNLQTAGTSAGRLPFSLPSPHNQPLNVIPDKCGNCVAFTTAAHQKGILAKLIT